MIKTYTYKLKPNANIEQKFNNWVGICRFVYNCSKDLKEQCYQKGVKLSKFDIQKQLTESKQEFDWLKEVHSQTLQAIVDRLDDNFKKFFKGAGYPKWASKKKWKSIPFKSIKTTHNAFKLPSFGTVKVFKFKEPKGILKTATLIREGDGIFLKVVVEEYDSKPYSENQAVCGIDLGVKYFLTTSDGEFVDNPKHLFNHLSTLRIENRKLSRMKKGGSNFKKQVVRLQRLHLKVKRSRLDFLQKESTKLAIQYSSIVIEDLNIKGMSRNSKLAKHILDCGWGMFGNLLEYKTNVVRINPKFTSQKCNECGHTCKENRLTQSHFECVECGHVENADLNASKNIFQSGQRLMEANVVQ